MSDNIYTAIIAVMNEVGYVQKTRAKKLTYTFASEAALIQALRPAMVEQGIFCYVAGVEDFSRTEYETKGGTTMFNTSLTAVVVFHHAPSGTSIVVQARGEGSDVGDKSGNKAMTCALKYALRQTFLIETGDDPDKDASVEVETTDTSAEPQLDMKSLFAYGAEKGVSEKDVRNAVKEAGFKSFDPSDWDKLTEIVDGLAAK